MKDFTKLFDAFVALATSVTLLQHEWGKLTDTQLDMLPEDLRLTFIAAGIDNIKAWKEMRALGLAKQLSPEVQLRRAKCEQDINTLLGEEYL